ncbi:MAG: hypothetical protein K5838_07465 [Elusimicrobiales bacterium]|nr:hypothetical protein [Elusimicrobiales bacterium]
MIKFINRLAVALCLFWGIFLGYMALFPKDPLFGFMGITFNFSRTGLVSLSEMPGLRIFYAICSALLFIISIFMHKKFKKEENRHS